MSLCNNPCIYDGINYIQDTTTQDDYDVEEHIQLLTNNSV